MAQTYTDAGKDILIKAENVQIGENVTFGTSIDIQLKGDFVIGDRSHLGNDIQIRGHHVRIGCDLFHSQGLRVGGGGRQHPNANLEIGDRCTIHNNFINVCERVKIGNDVGLSPEVSILTHGYWLSVLEGYPARFAPVTISDGAIIGYRSLIMMGVTIGERAVIGAQSVVTKNAEPNSIYAGSPAKFIKKITPPTEQEKRALVAHILKEYRSIAEYHSVRPVIVTDYPIIQVNDCRFNVETLAFEGREDEETDDFRDYVRKWGLRFYSSRPFKSVWNQ
jgi:acetyltransferase-like isoleucine patch superfamily enzyme